MGQGENIVERPLSKMFVLWQVGAGLQDRVCVVFQGETARSDSCTGVGVLMAGIMYELPRTKRKACVPKTYFV